MNDPQPRDCASTHFGPWMVRDEWMQDAVAAIKAGTWKPKAACGEDDDDAKRYETVNGVAVISVAGHITKNPSSFGGTSTIRTRQSLRMAAKDRGVKSIMLVIDSPGGSVSGVSDVADDIRMIDADKPVYAYADSGLCCSAAYWIASACRRIYCNASALVGNIGVYGVLVDTSEADRAAGLRYVLISTGGVKGAGADGKITEELIADYQREINEYRDLFHAAVLTGRRFSSEQLAAVSDGRAFVGAQALPFGLVDEIATLDVAMQAVISETNTMQHEDFMRAAAEHADWLSEAAKPAIEAAQSEAINTLQSEVDAAKADKDDAVKAAKSEGFDEGVSVERGRCAALVTTFKGDTDQIAAAIEAGHDIAKAKAEAFDRLQATLAKQGENKAAAGATDSGDGVAPLATVTPEPPADPSKIEDPKARAEAEFEAMSDDDKAKWISKPVFVAARIRELRK